jgi:hypothetical protein
VAKQVAGDEYVSDVGGDVGAHAGTFEERLRKRGEGDDGVALLSHDAKPPESPPFYGVRQSLK